MFPWKHVFQERVLSQEVEHDLRHHDDSHDQIGRLFQCEEETKRMGRSHDCVAGNEAQVIRRHDEYCVF